VFGGRGFLAASFQLNRIARRAQIATVIALESAILTIFICLTGRTMVIKI
jgi:hypothetical protein